MKKKLLLIFLSFNLFIISCNEKQNSTPNTNSQTYSVTITFKWTAAQHGTLPSGGHFTSIFSATHNNDFTLYATGSLLSVGMEDLAETGNTSTIIGAATNAKGTSVLEAAATGSGTFAPTATHTFDIKVNPEYPYLSLATMIAPSPDWFIGLSKIILYENGSYKSSLSGDIRAYDGGTKEGEGFSLSNTPTSPAKTVSALTSMNGVSIDFTQKPIASYTIQKK